MHLHFPNAQRFARPAKDKIPLARVSHYAIDLIRRLLLEKEIRICSRRYAENDLQPWGRCAASRFASPFVHGEHFVYPNDAEEIKSHSFFRGIPWETIHMRTPPWIPQVRDDLAEYFESEQDILSDLDPAASNSDSEQEAINAKETGDTTPPMNSPFGRFLAIRRWDLEGNKADVQAKKPRKVRGKRRPRDKMLRDPQVGRKVMEIRKRVAFLGYTYRRPATWIPHDDVGKRFPRAQLPTFG